jgi:regulator of ribonuclease activity A
MIPTTTDLCDVHGDVVRVVDPIFRDYGGRRHFAGLISTVKVLEDNVLVRAALEEPSDGRVLVVDGGGLTRFALMGDQMANLGQQNGWAGVVLHAAIRDVEALATVEIGIKALAACPRRSAKNGLGERDVLVTFGGVTFKPGEWLVADADGIVISATPLGLE